MHIGRYQLLCIAADVVHNDTSAVYHHGITSAVQQQAEGSLQLRLQLYSRESCCIGFVQYCLHAYAAVKPNCCYSGCFVLKLLHSCEETSATTTAL